HDDPKTWEEIKANGHAAILGVGHCSTCAPAVATHAITLDVKYGVPSVALHTATFQTATRSVRRVAGLPNAPTVFVPQPVMGKTAAGRKAYVNGADPAPRRPVMQEIVAALTLAVPLGAEEHDTSTPRLVAADSDDTLHQLFLDSDWTDKLPIVLPTEERV